MVNKNILDNLTGQEIKEMINAEKIELEKLDASALRKLMDYEIDMICLGNGDEELVSQCALLLNELDSPEMTREELINIIDKTEEQYVTIVPQETVRHKVPQKRGINKRTALIAAVLAVSIIASALVSCGVIFDFFEYLAEIARAPVGTQITVDGITFYNNGESRKYSSIEEVMEQENLDIMYPTKWPKGVELESVRIVQGTLGNNTILFCTNDTNINMEIELNSTVPNCESETIYKYKEITFYIEERTVPTATGFYNGNTYYISAKTKEDLIVIIESMKEFNK